MKSHPCKVFSLSPLTQYILVPSFFYSAEDLGMLYADHHGISTPHRSPKSRMQHSPSDISPNSPAENHPVPRPLHRLLHHISRNRWWRTSHITHSQQMTDNRFPFRRNSRESSPGGIQTIYGPSAASGERHNPVRMLHAEFIHPKAARRTLV